MSDPLPVIPLEYAKPSDDDRRTRIWRWVNRIGLAAGAGVALVGWVVLLFEVETVLASGPALFTIGLAMAVGGFNRHRPWIWGIGLAHCAVCLLFVGLVNLLSWSPREAEQPFAGIGAAYNLLTLPAAIWAWVRRAE